MSEKGKACSMAAAMLVTGGIIGAGLALLLAPQSGKRTRRDIGRLTRKMRRKAEGAVEEFSANVSEMVETVGDRAEDLIHKGKDMTQESRKDLLKVLEQGQALLEKQKARLSRLIG